MRTAPKSAKVKTAIRVRQKFDETFSTHTTDIRITPSVDVGTIDGYLCFWTQGREIRMAPRDHAIHLGLGVDAARLKVLHQPAKHDQPFLALDGDACQAARHVNEVLEHAIVRHHQNSKLRRSSARVVPGIGRPQVRKVERRPRGVVRALSGASGARHLGSQRFVDVAEFREAIKGLG